MTATIAIDWGESVPGSLHYQALFAIGVVLFVMTFIINLVADYITHRMSEVYR
jgi:ABC-type phosphate transport system permease subunit